MIDDKYNYIDTDYFLVGGFDSEKGIGCIKLYKIIFDNEKYENKIEFVLFLKVSMIELLQFKNKNFLYHQL